MKYLKVIAALMLTTVLGFSQQTNFNLVEIANVPFAEGCNDIWGYVDGNGTEYALVGTRTASVVMSLEDPTNPIQRARIEGVQSTWRDFKTFGEYAYCIADVGEDGLLIINMSGAPNNITHKYLNVPFTYNGGSDIIRKCHNVFIDENGYMYLSGCNTGTNGVMIFDLNPDPENPTFVGAEAANYSHDNVVQGDTLFSSDLTQGLSLWDVSDKANPVEIGRQRTTSNFCHNAWFSDDLKYVFTTDERPDAYMDAYDISDLSNIQRLDAYRPKSTEGRGVIPHNAHWIDGYLVTSWYTDGVKIIDGNKPDNLVEVASFDSWAGPDGGFNGCWGAYPWLPSGLVLTNDIQRGLFVLQPEYERACYLEGTVTDAITKDAINGATIVIENADFINEKNSDFNGEYRTGQAAAGTFDVTFDHPDYIAQTVQAELKNGEVTILNVELAGRPFFKVSGTVIDAVTKDPVPNAQLFFSNDNESYSGESNGLGLFDLAVFEDMTDPTYDIVAGSWGYLHKVVQDELIDGNVQLTIELDAGYQDDFLLDQGWEVVSTAPRGIWERGVPIETTSRGQVSNTGLDIHTDLGDQCYVTGNGGGGAGDDDVDNGVTILRSPVMDLSTANDPEVSYRTWFYNAGGGSQPNDEMVISIGNAQEKVTLEVLNTSASVWRDSSKFLIADYIELTDSVYIEIQASDDQAEGHLVEGGFDEFRVVDRITTSVSSLGNKLDWSLSPTIVNDQLQVTIGFDVDATLELIDLEGRVIQTKDVNQGITLMDPSALSSGLYMVRIRTENNETESLKFIKQ